MEKERKYWNPTIETLPRERLVEIELKRFREVLRWAKEASPFVYLLRKNISDFIE